jgi:hypothetical protein
VTKPTPHQVWQQLLDEAGEDAIEAVLALTPEQVEAELAGAGLDVAEERGKAERFLEDLAAGGQTAAQAVEAVEPRLPLPLAARRRRPRTALVLLAAATAAAAAGGLAYSALHRSPAPPAPSPQPSPSPVPVPPAVPDLVAASDLRQKAAAACEAQRWDDCLADLDRARALDPAGDDAPPVKSLRDQALTGIRERTLK